MALVALDRSHAERTALADRSSVDLCSHARSQAHATYPYQARIRLTHAEASALHYVLVGWESEVGCASNFGATIDALTSRVAPDASARAEAREARTVQPHAAVRPFDARRAHPSERWADRGKREQRAYEDPQGCASSAEVAGILRCYRTLVALARARNPSAVVLCCLFGDRPPGLPDVTLVLHNEARDYEYRRVVRLVDASGGTSSALRARLHVDRHTLPGESESAHRARVARAEADRRAILAEICRACERLIVASAVDYRAAWRALGGA
jgi:hypothetical protein